MANKTYMVYRAEDKRWVSEEADNGTIVKHYYTAKRRAILGVLHLNPGRNIIIIAFPEK